VVERRYRERAPAAKSHSRGDVQERHRVQAARDREYRASALWQRAPDEHRQISRRRPAVTGLGTRRLDLSPLCHSTLHLYLQVASIRTVATETLVESNGPLGVLWVGVALGAFYIALIWLNTLLGFFLTPLFLIPQTWLMDFVAQRRARRNDRDIERETPR
jgi:hypothetical protein